MTEKQKGLARSGSLISLLIAAAVVVLFLLPTPKPGESAHAAATDTAATVSADCIKTPADFSSPAVLARTAPASLWKGWTYGHSITLSATPATALMDQPVTIRVTGLKPGEPVTLRASLSGYQKHTFVAQATFIADAHGQVDVARQAPKYGGYSGVHAMGLIWSMQPHGVKQPAATFYGASGFRFPIELEALADGRVLGKTTLTRNLMAPGVTKTEVSSDGLVGELFTPATPGHHPAVIVLGGSEGGLYPQVNEAALLASHGYVALGLAYFQGFQAGDPRLASVPKMLANIPLEYFVKAAQWLQQQPGVDPHHLAIMGWSKGAEAALIAAASFPKDFQAVIAFMPSSVVWQGLNYGQGQASSSWSLHGQPMPWLGYAEVDPNSFAAAYKSGKPYSLVSIYRPMLDKAKAAKAAAIPVERIAGSVLLISAGDDQIWPSAYMAQQIMRRLAMHQHDYADESLCYAGAGHGILPPWRPTNASAAGPVAFGGNPVAYAFADQDAWRQVLAFLHKSLQ